jgi:hypothetical protein
MVAMYECVLKFSTGTHSNVLYEHASMGTAAPAHYLVPARVSITITVPCSITMYVPVYGYRYTLMFADGSFLVFVPLYLYDYGMIERDSAKYQNCLLRHFNAKRHNFWYGNGTV